MVTVDILVLLLFQLESDWKQTRCLLHNYLCLNIEFEPIFELC